ncbi:GntR family transcriptional regulator [Halothermothrix orenii]|uniref:Regulatory protein GntR HTH n=1 Tax=Halothermothrix orenii (strain H 168 / OCM 544 / DSM 9562) TaxID=373903 RepID=B8CY86_HALOH|nr:GntR family transcriptional regulator [Halothermothrix orenii]ACL70255.1 regulatory protein GntR HTH [Halothermothrix orenii H 168]
MELNRKSDKPLYKQIEDIIINKIKDGILKPGKALPSERELGKELEVSRLTVRKAIQELEQKGILYKIQGKGTFVNDRKKAGEHGNKIGVISHLYKGVFMEILEGIEEGLESESYEYLLRNSQNDYKKEENIIQAMKEEGVSGFIISPVEDQKDSNVIFNLKAEGYPIVLIDRKLNYCETDCVLSDNIDGGFKATEYLIKLGHSRIAFLTYEFRKTSSVRDRIKGYRYALKLNQLELDERLLFSYNKDLSREEKNKILYNFIKENKPTAIIGVHNDVALDVVKMCRANNISIPEDISIICFDNTDIVRHLEVPLTTLVQDARKIGYDAAKLIVKKINSQEETGIMNQIYHPVKLIERNSCKSILQKNEK